MNKNILQHLFDGEIQPLENIGVDNEKLKSIRDMLAEEKEILSKTLNDDSRNNFSNINELHREVISVHGYECFVHGFKLGVMLLHEALHNTDMLTRNSVS